MTTADVVRWTLDDEGVGRITLDAGATRNALSRELASQLRAAIASLGACSPRVIVLEHEGPIFCSGGDIRPDAAPRPEDVAAVISDLVEVREPLVAKVRGGAYGIGLALVAIADLSYVEEGARFSLPEVGRGLVPALATVLLSRRLAQTTMLRLALTGDTFSGDDGGRWGLFTAAVPESRLDRAVDEVVERLAGAPAHALRAAKRAVRDVAPPATPAELGRAANLARIIAGGARP